MSNKENLESIDRLHENETDQIYYEKLSALLSKQENPKEEPDENPNRIIIDELRRFSEVVKPLLEHLRPEPDLGYVGTFNALKFLDISKRQLQKLRDAGQLDAWELGGKLFYKKSDLNQLLKRVENSVLKKRTRTQQH